MFWDNLINEVNRAKSKIRIHGNTYLDQECPKRKRLLEININSRDQPERAQKSGAISF